MFAEDVHLLRCPKTQEELTIGEIAESAEDGEILEGRLVSTPSGNSYEIRNGIPRFVVETGYNRTWDYKWTKIDRGRGLNYRIADKDDPAYKIHDIFDRNSHGGKAYEHATGGVVLDLGCGVGQYSWRMMIEYRPVKLVSMDLTGGVDVFRKIMLERFPELKKTILIVQGNVFEMPFRDESFDYVFSLGVFNFTGDTREAVRQAGRVTKQGGELNFWLYASEPVPYEAHEPGRTGVKSPFGYLPLLVKYSIVWGWIMAFRHLPHWFSVGVIWLFSSEVWYRLNKVPLFGYLPKLIFGTVMHPDRDYRFINNYNGYRTTWAETWNEQELFPALRDAGIVIKGLSDWRLGIWGVKNPDFYS